MRNGSRKKYILASKKKKKKKVVVRGVQAGADLARGAGGGAPPLPRDDLWLSKLVNRQASSNELKKVDSARFTSI